MVVTVATPRVGRSPEWPEDVLDVAALRADGWRPVPFRQFLLKVHSRCNLACDYCYVYEMADQSWRSRPVAMSAHVVDQTARRIAEHAERHSLDEVRVILHGGEPLLAGRDFFARTARTIRSSVAARTRVELGMQTNAVLLDERFLDVLLEHRIRIGVSLDGDRSAHDRHRLYANGRGSHDGVVKALHLLRQDRYAPLFTGLLCTIDLHNDPVSTYEALLEFEPPSMDFLLPHGNWSAPPPERSADPALTPYADWLIAVFDRWYAAPHRESGIRFFEEIINLLVGGRSHVESIGLTAVNLIVVEADGTLEQVDSLKAAFHGAPATGLNIFDHDFDAALNHPAIAARQLGIDGLCETCRRCPVRDICGGGLYPHRYRGGEGFLNPSVYCPDLLRLIGHIRDRLHAGVSQFRLMAVA
jgi:uncharacterized protein